MSRLFTPLIQLFDASGATAGAGTITFFAQGATTLQGTFQDAARTLANENPLTVDGSGLSPAIYLQYLNYTVLAQDSDGATLWEKDFDGRWLADGSDYTRSGTGAVARTVQSRLEDLVSAKDFGATGDGATDDTVALQAFLDHLQTKDIDGLLPQGDYMTTARLNVTAACGIIGDGWGSRIFSQTSSTHIIILVQEETVGVDRFLLKNIEIDGNNGGQLDAGLVQLNNIKKGLCENVRVHNTTRVSGSQGVNGISVSGDLAGGAPTSTVDIISSLIENVSKPGVNFSGGAKDCHAISTISRNNSGQGSASGFQFLGSKNCSLIDCTGTGNEGSGALIGAVGTTPVQPAENTQIIGGNYSDNGTGSPTGTTGFGIQVGNAEGSVGRPSNITIDGPICENNGVDINAEQISIANVDGVHLKNTKAIGGRVSGYFFDDVTQLRISGNEAIDNNSTTNASHGGYIARDCRDVTFENNQQRDSTGKAAFGINFLSGSAADNDDWRISDNKFDDFTNEEIGGEAPSSLRMSHKFAEVTTTDATVTDVFNIGIADNSAASVRVFITGMKDGGSERADYDKQNLFYRDGSTTAAQGSIQINIEKESDANWDMTVAETGNAVRGRVTGVAATTIRWACEVDWRSVN